MSFLWYLDESVGAMGWMVGFEESGMEGFLWLIQSPSGTGCRTEAVGFDMMWFSPFWFVEDVRGGMALGERSWEFSDAIADAPG
jgi:hypothetical protein